DRFGERVQAAGMDALSERLSGADLFVNTTSLGMDENEAPDIDFSTLASGALVTDIVYVPLETPFLLKAKEQGLRTADGLGMLLHQAVPGFELWFGKRPTVTEKLRSLILADIGAH
ncbi:MAG: shikimate 5-dehydrogenase, partial [Pseudomonadota bacterium]